MFMEQAPKIVIEKRGIVKSKIIQINIPNFEGSLYITFSKIIGSVPAQSFMTPGGMLPKKRLL